MEIGPEAFDGLRSCSAEWVAIIPYGYTRRGSSTVEFDSEFQWWGERYAGTIEMIVSAREKGLNVVLKPQIWIPGKWVGDFLPDEKEKWEESMTDFTMRWAHLADSLEVEIFCFATEFKAVALQNPDYFERLIDEIKKVFKGKLTYAANWDEYHQIDFWGKLDYIGVNAYFPLSTGADPSIEELEASWSAISTSLNQMSERYEKDILFTEFGYRSAPSAAQKPWDQAHAEYKAISQSTAFEALFSTVWKEPWLAGGFIWKWRFFDDAGGHGDPSFTPQGKPAMEVIQEVYSK
jgi:hypothetical protein